MSGNTNVTVRGIVVGRHAVGEGSARILLYTDLFGLVSPLAKSSREERSKLRAHLQVGTRGEFTLVKGREVWRLVGAVKTLNSFFGEEEKERSEAVANVLSIVRQFIKGEGHDEFLFEALWGFLVSISNADKKHIGVCESLAVFRLLSALGYVSVDVGTDSLLSSGYGSEALSEAENRRHAIVRTINEGITASGL